MIREVFLLLLILVSLLSVYLIYIVVKGYIFTWKVNQSKINYGFKAIKNKSTTSKIVFMLVLLFTVGSFANANYIYLNLFYSPNNSCAFNPNILDKPLLDFASNIEIIKIDGKISEYGFDVLDVNNTEPVSIAYYSFTSKTKIKSDTALDSNIIFSKRDLKIDGIYSEGCYPTNEIQIGNYYILVSRQITLEDNDSRFIEGNVQFEYRLIELPNYDENLPINQQNDNIQTIYSEIINLIGE